MTEKKGWRRYGAAAACGVLVLAVAAGAYRLGRAADPAAGGIGRDDAKAAALGHAGVAEEALSRYEVTLDGSGGAAVYEVRFEADGCSYDYEVSAADGSVVKFEKEPAGSTAADPAPKPGGGAGANGDIGEARAREIALGHAGVTADSVSGCKWEQDYDDGVLVYELEFFSGGYEYDYEISAADGSVVKFEKEPAAGVPAGSTAAAPAPKPGGGAGASGDIGEARAREIALGHAGVTADSVSGYKWEQDYDDGVLVYELEFFSGGYEYDYEISAADGSVVKFEKEPADADSASRTGQGTGEYIGEARAREIAYSYAGLAADAVTHCGVALDHRAHHTSHDGRHQADCCVYEVDFHCGGYEYEYKIDAITGAVLEYERDTAD